jgi:hypothetical protein
MVLNSHEMLLYMSYNSDIKQALHLTPQRLRSLRHKLAQRHIGEEYLAEALTKLGCKLVRPRVYLPVIVKDKNGRLFDEFSFVKMYFTRELAARYNVDYDKIIGKVRNSRSINRPLFKHILHKRRAWIVMDGMTIDSVWAYDPFELTYTKDKIVTIRSMLEGSVPMSDNPLDVLTYSRPDPVLEGD